MNSGREWFKKCNSCSFKTISQNREKQFKFFIFVPSSFLNIGLTESTLAELEVVTNNIC